MGRCQRVCNLYQCVISDLPEIRCQPPFGEKQCNSIIGNLNKRMYANMIIIITDKESERARGLPEVANCELCLTLETIRFSMGVRDMNIIRNILFTQA